jgi:hypothetical protein
MPIYPYVSQVVTFMQVFQLQILYVFLIPPNLLAARLLGVWFAIVP